MHINRSFKIAVALIIIFILSLGGIFSVYTYSRAKSFFENQYILQGLSPKYAPAYARLVLLDDARIVNLQYLGGFHFIDGIFSKLSSDELKVLTGLSDDHDLKDKFILNYYAYYMPVAQRIGLYGRLEKYNYLPDNVASLLQDEMSLLQRLPINTFNESIAQNVFTGILDLNYRIHVDKFEKNLAEGKPYIFPKIGDYEAKVVLYIAKRQIDGLNPQWYKAFSSHLLPLYMSMLTFTVHEKIRILHKCDEIAIISYQTLQPMLKKLLEAYSRDASIGWNHRYFNRFVEDARSGFIELKPKCN